MLPQSTKSQRTKLLGIDPSFTTMGAAIWDTSTKRLHLLNGTLDQVFILLQDRYDPSDLVAVIEDPSLDSPVFGAWEEMKSKISMIDASSGRTRLKAWKDAESTFRTLQAIAQNVGENKAAAKRTIKLLESLQIPYVRIRPSERKRADKLEKGERRLPISCFSMPTKTTKEQFYELTGYSGQSNEHSRDAATLVHKQTINWALVLYATQNKGEFFD